VPANSLKQAFGTDGLLFNAWLFLARILAPLGVLWMFVAGL